MKNLKESEKNFLTCAILIALVGFLRPNYIRNPEHHCGRRVCSNLFQDGNHEKKRGKRGRKRA